MAQLSILLPGLDGTGELFERFVAATPPSFSVRVQPLPSDRPRGYEELAQEISDRLPSEPCSLIAESFSGPLAILLADRCPQVRAIVLCATFIRAPLPRQLGGLPDFFWRRPPPAFAVRFLMTGGDAELAEGLCSSVAKIAPTIIQARARAALAVDVTRELQRLRQPILFIQAARDRLIPQRSTADLAAVKPAAAIAVVDGPHLILQARAADCWHALSACVDGT